MVKRLVLSLLLMMGGLPAFEWEIREFEGVEFVPVDEVAEFFRFEAKEGDAKTVSLENRDITVSLEPGSKVMVMNKLKFGLTHAIRVDGDRNWVATLDLLECLEPVLRPGLIKGAGSVRTVVVDPVVEDGNGDAVLMGQWFADALRAKGFEVVDLGKIGRKLTAEKKGKAISTFKDAFYLRVVLRGGETVSLRTEPLGGNTPVRQWSTALGTSVHGRTLPGLRKEVADAGDGGIGPAKDPPLTLGMVPGIQVELSMGALKAETLGPMLAKGVAKGLETGNRAIDRQDGPGD